jgi:hypothetical protein
MVVVIRVRLVVMVRTGTGAGDAALTGRRCRHSTPGLAVMSATTLMLTDFQQVV